MLKVVGASLFKTRLSSSLLSVFGLLAIGSLFIADMERPKFNGVYCATTYWSSKSGFRVEFWGQRNDLDSISKGSARTCYKDSISETGWAQIELETQANYPDKIQAISAGILEGALTWKNIYEQWSNTIQAECDKDDDSQNFCTWLRDIISKNFENIKSMSEMRGKHDHYWYQVRLFYYQLEGIEFGWRMGAKRSRSGLEIPFEDFLLLNAGVDIRDLKIYYMKFIDQKSKLSLDPFKAVMLLKIFENRIYFGHSSDGKYGDKLRMMKKYKFNFHFSESHKSNIVPGSNIEFTGYPGAIASQDDFYMISGRLSKLTVGGVKMQNNNTNVWKTIDLQDTVLMSARVMAANRLAHNGKTWSRILSRDPTTGSKQWLVIDMQNLKNAIPSKDNESTTEKTNESDFQTESISIELADAEQSGDDAEEIDVIPEVLTIENLYKLNNDGLFWVIDQIPGRLHAEDVTVELLKKGYWVGNGKPYFEEIQELSNMKHDMEENDILMDKLKQNITNLDDLGKLFRIKGSRRDLNITDKTEVFGNIDLKLVSQSNAGEFEFYAVSGPIIQENPAQSNITAGKLVEGIKNGIVPARITDDSKSRPFITQKIKMKGMDFKKVYHKWAWN